MRINLKTKGVRNDNVRKPTATCCSCSTRRVYRCSTQKVDTKKPFPRQITVN